MHIKINKLDVFAGTGIALSTVPRHSLGDIACLVYKTTSKVDFALDKRPDVVLDTVKIFMTGPVKM
jgi:hypothetical protein